MKTPLCHFDSRRAVQLLALGLACCTLAYGAFAQILPTAPFVGSLSESWESFPTGLIPGSEENSPPTRIMQGQAVVSGGRFFIYEPKAGVPWPLGDVNATVAGGSKGMGVEAGVVAIDFDHPVSAFGGYWAVPPGDSPNEPGEPNLIGFTFWDTSLSIIAGVTISPGNQQGTLEWHGWRSPRPIQRVTVGGLSLALDSLRARPFGAPPEPRPIAYTLAPGSTITTWDGNGPVGPTEALTGSFEWTEVFNQEQVYIYDTTRLDWRSPSWTIQSHSNHAVFGSVVYTVDSTATFGTMVQTPAFPGGIAAGASAGTYGGVADYPRTLEFLDLRLRNGGPILAEIHLLAVAVDGDGDGVPDDEDECPDTSLLGDAVDGQGCSIEQLVPCAGPITGGTWKSHGEYVAGVAKVAGSFHGAGLITAEEKKAIVHAAIDSDCGR